MKSQCFILEDQPEMKELLRSVVAIAYPELEVVCTSTCAEAKSWFLGRKASKVNSELPLALIDLGLPDGSAIDLIPDIVACAPETRVIVVSIFDDETHLFEAFKAGASGYLLKSESPEFLVDLLKRIAKDEAPVSPALAAKILKHFLPPDSAKPEVIELSARERQTLTLLAQGFSVPQAAKEMSLSPQTVSSYVKNIYLKLQVNNRAAATREAVRRGLV